jgi:hypothetical protein
MAAWSRCSEVNFAGGDVTQPEVQVGVPIPMSESVAALIEEKRVAPEPARLGDRLRRAS